MPGPATTFSWNWGAPNQDRNDRYNQQGELTELKNTRYTEGGAVEKRLGQAFTDIETFHGGTYEGPAVQLECADTVIWRDSSDQLWCWDPDNGDGYFRGLSQRATYTAFQVANHATASAGFGANKPLAVMRQGDLWSFSLGYWDFATSKRGYQLTIVDPTTQTVKRETTLIDAQGCIAYAACVDDTGAVWLVYVNGGTDIVAHRFTSVDGDPVISTYSTAGTLGFFSIDIKAVPGQNKVIVVAHGADDSAGDRVSGIYRSYALTSGGVATAESYTTATCSGGAGQEVSAVTILEHTMADGFFHIAYAQLKNSDLQKVEYLLEKVTLLTPATAVQTSLGTFSFAAYTATAVLSGCVDATSGYRHVLASACDVLAGSVSVAGGTVTWTNAYLRKNNMTVTKFTWDGAAVTTDADFAGRCRSAYVASKPFQQDGAWYFLSGFDDDDYRGVVENNKQLGVQNGYFVRDLSGRIVTSVLDGEGGVFTFARPTPDGLQLAQPYDSHVITPAVVDATHVAFALLNADLIRNRPGRTIAVVDFAPTFHSSAPGIVPGLPCSVAPTAPLTELSPIHYPYSAFTLTFDAGPNSTVNFITYLYRFQDPTGEVKRSAPYPVPVTPITAAFTSFSMTLRLPTLRHLIGSHAQIEVYGSINGGLTLYLQECIDNDPTVDYVELPVDPALWGSNGEILYTTGGGLANISPVPSRLAWLQGTRVMLGGTPSGEVWPSREWQQGRGPEFNPAFNFDTNKFGVGELQAAIEIDANSSALFKTSGIAIATGSPDGRGSGGWVVQDLHIKKGCGNPATVVKGPLGIYFPDHETGRMQLLAAGLVTDIAAGMVAYKDYVWTSAVDCPDERLIRWTATNGKRLTLQYGYPPADQPAGTWVLEEGDGLIAAVGAALIDNVHVALAAGEADSALISSPSPGVSDADFLDDGDEVLMAMKALRMAPAGFMGELDTDTVTLSSQWLGGASTYEYSMIPGKGAAEVHPDIASEDADVSFRTAIYRQREVGLGIRETSATGRGRRFDGVAIEMRTYGRIKKPYRQIG